MFKKTKEVKLPQCRFCHNDITSKTLMDPTGGRKVKLPCAIMRGPSEEMYLHNSCLKKMIAQLDEEADKKRNRMPENKTVSQKLSA